MGACAQKRPLCSGCRKRPSNTSGGGGQPVKTTLSGDKFDFPGVVLTDEFVVALGNTQYFVYRRDPFRGHPLLADHGREYFAQGSPEPPGLLEQGLRSLRIGLRQAQKLRSPVSRNNAGGL